MQYNRAFNRGNWASAFVWGRNHVSEPGEIKNLNGYTAESTVQFLDKNYLYIRLEQVDKDDLLRASKGAKPPKQFPLYDWDATLTLDVVPDASW